MTVSIITVAYDSAATIADTLESVLAQTYADIDYWVIDGGSTDGTLDLLRRYAPRFGGRMHYVSEPDGGIYDAMNKGIRRATGDVVGILNSDDFFTSPDVIERMASAFAQAEAEGEPLDAVYGDGHYAPADRPDRCVRYYSGRWYRPSLARYGFMPHHPSFYARRSLFERYGYYKADYRISADFELITRFVCCHRISVRYLHLDFVTMRMGGVSTRGLQSILTGTEEDLRACRELGIPTSRLRLYVGKYVIKLLSMLLVRS